jgi:hypothetical protein
VAGKGGRGGSRGVGKKLDRAKGAALLTSDVLARFVEEGLTTERPAWVRRVRQWARDRARRPDPGDA